MLDAGRARRSGPGLWADPDFLKFWTAQTVSRVGTQVTFLALPLTAVVLLDASPAQVGWLATVEYLPYFFSLWAGVIVDRLRRRRLVVGADIGLSLVMGVVPVAAATHHLTYPALLGVAFAVGCLTMLIEIAQTSYLPTVVRRVHLLEANTKLEVGRVAAQVSGSGLGGLLIQALSAPIAIAADSASYLVAGCLMARIAKPEAPPPRQRTRVLAEVQEGLRMALALPLRPLLFLAALDNLVLSAQGAVFVLYMARDLSFPPAWIGFVTAASSIGGALLGLAGRRSRLGQDLHRRVSGAQSMLVASIAIMPIATLVSPVTSLALMIASGFLYGAATVVLFVTIVTARQALTPDALLGRVSAAWRFLAVTATPAGAFLGGTLGQALGLPTTFFLCATGLCVPLVLIARAESRAGLALAAGQKHG